MRLPQQKKILREDLKDAPAWINGITSPVNTFMENVYNSLNRNLTLSENIASFTQEFTYTTLGTYPTGQANISFLNQLKTKPIGVMVMQVYDKATYIPAPGPVYIPWVEVNGSIIIYPITGLEVSKTYLIRVVVF